jgi:putative effector of murein hydrolase
MFNSLQTLQVFAIIMKFDERNKKKFKIPPLFISMATAAKFVLPIAIFFWLISFH